MKFDIISDLPGRLRVHCFSMQLTPDCRIELNRWVSCHEELVSASFSLRTGNLLVHYSRTMNRESMVAHLEDLRMFDVATVGKYREDEADAAVNAVTKACKKSALSLIKKAALPKCAQQTLGTVKIGIGVLRLCNALYCGDLGGFLKDAVKFATMVFFGKSLVFRFFFILVMEMANSSRISPAMAMDGEFTNQFPSGTQPLPLLPAPAESVDGMAG